MKTQHTSGPWYYEEANIRNADGLDVATIDTERSTSRSQYDPVPEEEWIANTHLIAAAPELLAALKDMLRSFETGEHYETRNPYSRPYVQAALAAITKAEGREE